jgi:lipoate-protein ligase A
MACLQSHPAHILKVAQPSSGGLAQFLMWTYLTSNEKADAETQMALDAELLQECEDSPQYAFLRFYRMDPPAVTIGRNQQWQRVVDSESCTAQGWDWVRRPTGGGALLHKHEVNYAVVIGGAELAKRRLKSFTSVFNWIAHGLSEGVGQYAPDLTIHSGRSSDSDQPRDEQYGLCGRSLTRYEIGSPDGKIVAAAQMIRNGAVLQHGTIYLRPPSPIDCFWPQNQLVGRGLDVRTSNSPSLVKTQDTDSAPLAQRWAGLGERACGESWDTIVATLRDRFIHASGLAGIEHESVSTKVCSRLEARRVHWQNEGWHRRR